MNKWQSYEGQQVLCDNFGGYRMAEAVSAKAQTPSLGSWALVRADLFPGPCLTEKKEGQVDLPLVFSLSF